jgi:hypothetical protein
MLQGAHLMGHTKLMLPGMGFQLTPIAIAHPHFWFEFAHDISDHFRTTVTNDDMQDTRQGAENPFPRIPTVYPVTSFVTMNHLAFANVVLDLLDPAHSPLSSPFHDLIDPTLADLYLVQVS